MSCSKSELESPSKPGAPNSTPVSVTLGIASAPAPLEAYDPAAAKATKTSEDMGLRFDSQIHDLWAVQYDETGNLVGTPYYTTDIPKGRDYEAPEQNVDYWYDGLSLKLTSNPEANGKIYFIANTHNGTLFTVDNAVPTLTDFRKVQLKYGQEYQPTATGGILMMGTYTGPVASGTPITGIRLERLAAKVVFKYKNSVENLTISTVKLRGAPQYFSFVEPFDEDYNGNYPKPNFDNYFDYPLVTLNVEGTDADYRTFVWYMPENMSSCNVDISALGDRTVEKTNGWPGFVEVTGFYKDDDHCRRVRYRMMLGDVSTKLTDFHVRRNHVYTLTLDIKGLNEGDNRLIVDSYDMSNSAMIPPGAGYNNYVTFDIRKCLNNGFTTAEQFRGMLGAGSQLRAEILWTDNPALPGSLEISLQRGNGLLSVLSKEQSTETGNAEIALYDAQTGGNILWSWHIWVTDYNPNTLVGGTELGYANRTANTAIPVVGGQVHTYGPEYMKVNPGKVIMDRNLGATKSYNGRVPASGDNTADQAFGMFYQWGRKDPFPRAAGATIDVTTAKADATPIYGPDGNKLDDETSGVSGSGMRKVSIANVIGGATNTLAYSVKNPLTFIGSSSDWYATVGENSNSLLWGEGGPKSAYDPCPKGWRIAPYGTWSDFTFDAVLPENGTFPYYVNGSIFEGGTTAYPTNGRFYKASDSGTGTPITWYPAAGTRSFSTGNLGLVGKCGYSWSSTPVNGFYSKYLDFNMVAVSLDTPAARANGLQVRCIQE